MYVAGRSAGRLAPEAAAVPSTVIDSFVSPVVPGRRRAVTDLVAMGHLEPVKNHRYMLEVLAEAARPGGVRLTYGEGRCAGTCCGGPPLGLDGQVGSAGSTPACAACCPLPGLRTLPSPVILRRSSSRWRRACPSWRAYQPIAELCTEGVEARFWPWTTRPGRSRAVRPARPKAAGRRRGAGAVPPRVRRRGYRPRLWAFLRNQPRCIMTGRQKIL
jgi:hypothetical protein